jgi:hypothetical protein
MRGADTVPGNSFAILEFGTAFMGLVGQNVRIDEDHDLIRLASQWRWKEGRCVIRQLPDGTRDRWYGHAFGAQSLLLAGNQEGS